MEITPELANDLAYPLNESRLLGIEPDEATRTVRIGFSVFTLPETETAPRSAVVTLLLTGVGRIAVSYRLGKWNDAAAPTQPLSLSELAGAVAGFGQQPVYGWEFVDPPEERWDHWRERLSLDVDWAQDGRSHVIDPGQEDWSWEKERILDVRVCFDELTVIDADDEEIPVPLFIERSRQWWSAFSAGDPRTQGHGMHPLRADGV